MFLPFFVKFCFMFSVSCVCATVNADEPDPQTSSSVEPTTSHTTNEPPSHTTSPVNTETTAYKTTAPTTTVELTTMKWSIPLDNTDPTTLLQKLVLLQDAVHDLEDGLIQLKEDLDPTNSDLISQLQDAQTELESMQFDLNVLNQTIPNAVSAFELQQEEADSLDSILVCLANSNCFTPPPTTTPGPTTAPRATPCASAVTVFADNSTSVSYESALNFNCSTKIISGDNYPIFIDIAAQLNGSTVRLTAIDGTTGKTLLDETGKDVNETLNTATTIVILQYSATELTDLINFSLNITTESPCAGFECGNGTCIVDAFGTKSCSCFVCYTADASGECNTKTDPCLGYMPSRVNCPTDKGTCSIDEASTGSLHLQGFYVPGCAQRPFCQPRSFQCVRRQPRTAQRGRTQPRSMQLRGWVRGARGPQPRSAPRP